MLLLRVYDFLSLLDDRLLSIGIGHLLVLSTLGGLLGSLLGLASLLLSLLGGLLGLELLEEGLPLSLNLVEVALDDGAGKGADLFDLGDVDGLGGIVTLIVEPVLLI